MIDDRPQPDQSPPDPAAAQPGTPVMPGSRPVVERVGMAAIAAGVTVLFAGMAAMSFASGEPFLGAMAVVGALMTAWVGTRTLLHG